MHTTFRNASPRYAENQVCIELWVEDEAWTRVRTFRAPFRCTRTFLFWNKLNNAY